MSDLRRRSLAREARGRGPLAAIKAAEALARTIPGLVRPTWDDTIHRLSAESAAWTLCGLVSAPVWTIDCRFDKWLSQPYRQPLDALRICLACASRDGRSWNDEKPENVDDHLPQWANVRRA